MGNLKEKASVKFDLMMVLTVVIMFLVVMIAFSVISVEISIGSFTRFGSPCVYECVAQYGSRAVGLGGGGVKGSFTYLFRCWC